MKLQVLVNHYKEDFSIVERFLKSLQTQIQENVELEVFICSDGGEVQLTNELMGKYTFPIKYAYAPHSGVCHTRNILLDKSSTEYIMFCDIDDEFSKPDGIASLIKAAEETHADVVASPFNAERQTDTGFEYYSYEKDMIHVHGKIFRRQFLIDNNIRFPDDLEYSGDMMFLWLVFALSNHIVWIENNFFTWKWNPTSVTRKSPYGVVATFRNTLKCYSNLAEDLKKRGKYGLYQNLIATFMSMTFIHSFYPEWRIAPKDLKDDAMKALYDCLNTYFEDYKRIDAEYRRNRFDFMIEFLHANPVTKYYDMLIPWGENIIHPSDVLIIGYGIVGHNLEKEFAALRPAIYDKYKGVTKFYNKMKHYAIAFICVDTPKNEKSLCDITEVKNAIMENNADIFVIKSTILPGTVDKLCAETGKNIIFSPEYYGETQHCNNYTFDYTILGGNRESCLKVLQKLQKVYDGRHQFRIVDAKTAELVKYMENSFLATKVSFCQQFFNLAEEIGVDYEDVRELFVLDPRVNPSHTFVYRDTPWWDSKCLNKDVPAIAETYNAPLLLDIINFNEEQKKKYKK